MKDCLCCIDTCLEVHFIFQVIISLLTTKVFYERMSRPTNYENTVGTSKYFVLKDRRSFSCLIHSMHPAPDLSTEVVTDRARQETVGQHVRRRDGSLLLLHSLTKSVSPL